MRTTVKRLRALLRLLRPLIAPSTFTRENARLQGAARRLASGRDCTVARKTLTTLADAVHDHSDRTALLRLRGQLKPHPTASKNSSLARDLAASARDLATARRALLRMRIRTSGWNLLDIPEAYRRARKRMKKALKHLDAETFHHWRIAVKRFYYQLTWLELFWPKHLARMIPDLHHLEDALGEDHDLSVLQEQVASLTGKTLAPETSAILQKAVKHRSRHLRHRCQSLGKRLFHESPHAFGKKFRHHATRFGR
jgi:CHAD domain-containing protein